MSKLDNFQMKLVNVAKVIVTIIGSVSLALGLWLYFVSNETNLSIWFPMFWGAISLYIAYRTHRAIASNNGTINGFQAKCLFFAYIRGTLVCLTYLAITLNDIVQSIGFACFTLFVIALEILIRRMENKKVKNNVQS